MHNPGSQKNLPMPGNCPISTLQISGTFESSRWIFPNFPVLVGYLFSFPGNEPTTRHPSIHPLWQSQCFFWHFLWVFPKMVGFPPITAPPSHGPFLVGKNPMVCWVPNPPFVGKPPHISRKLVHLRVVDQSSLGIGRWEWSGKGHRAVRMQPLCLWKVRCRSGAWGRSSNKKREELHDYGHDLSASMRFSDWVVVF